MTLQDFPHGMIIDCTGDSQVDVGFFLLIRETYGERADPEMNRLVIDFSGLPPRRLHEEKNWVRHLFELR
jgi:hypothetical protein